MRIETRGAMRARFAIERTPFVGRCSDAKMPPVRIRPLSQPLAPVHAVAGAIIEGRLAAAIEIGGVRRLAVTPRSIAADLARMCFQRRGGAAAMAEIVHLDDRALARVEA